MASRGWGKNKKGYLVNSEGKTARQVKQEKYAAKKAEAKAKASGGGGSGEKGTAKPANKGSDGVDVGRFVERSGNKLISTDSRLTRFDFDMVSSRKTARDFDVEADAQKIATLKVGTNVPLVGMTKDGKIEVVSGDREFFAAKRASVLNPEADMVGAMVLKGSEIKGALAQKSLFKSHEGDFAVVTGKFSRVDTPDIVSSQKPPSKRVLDKQIEAILQTGEVGNVVPVVLRRVGKKSLVNQKYEIVSGHDSYHAMRELQRRNPNYEMTNAFILD